MNSAEFLSSQIVHKSLTKRCFSGGGRTGYGQNKIRSGRILRFPLRFLRCQELFKDGLIDINRWFHFSTSFQLAFKRYLCSLRCRPSLGCLGISLNVKWNHIRIMRVLPAVKVIVLPWIFTRCDPFNLPLKVSCNLLGNTFTSYRTLRCCTFSARVFQCSGR